MHIIVKNKKSSFYGDRHSRRMSFEDAERYKLRSGMAKVALRSVKSGQPECDSRGVPLKFSNEMWRGHSASTLEQWAKGRSTRTTIGVPSANRRTPWPWEKK